MFYGFTKSVKGYENCPILMKTSQEVALLGKILQFFSENVVCFTKSDWNLPDQMKITQQVIPVRKHILVLFSKSCKSSLKGPNNMHPSN